MTNGLWASIFLVAFILIGFAIYDPLRAGAVSLVLIWVQLRAMTR